MCPNNLEEFFLLILAEEILATGLPILRSNYSFDDYQNFGVGRHYRLGLASVYVAGDYYDKLKKYFNVQVETP